MEIIETESEFMKKFLPNLIQSSDYRLQSTVEDGRRKTEDKKSGFTLVELLVVISIIAILSVIGMAIFTGVQKNARDAKRRADIDAIGNALEVAKTSTTYASIDGTKFANSSVPTDSGNVTSGMTYCVLSNTTAIAPTAISAAWSTAACPSSYTAISSTAVTMVTSALSWTVCASLEATTGTTAYCRSSSQ